MTEMDYGSRIRKAVEERGTLDGMRRSFDNISARQRENLDRIPDIEDRKKRLRGMKEASVGNQELLDRALSNMRENGFRVVIAKTAKAATALIAKELSGYDLVVKSKSNVTKEIGLAGALGKAGITVVETDLGDRIIQLAGCAAAHPTGPACHLTRKEIAVLFTEHFGRPVSEDPLELSRAMRDEIAGYLSKAEVGITGANAIAAEEGAVLIVHNEGNAAKCAMLPDKHIIVTTSEKIVPNLEDALNIAKLQTYLSTGKIVSSYINVITGPSYTADIEKKILKGMHGPKEVLVVIVDDGRLSAADKEPQYCIGCGMCLLHCPVYDVLGPLFGSHGHMGGQGVWLAGSVGKLDESIDAGLNLCTECGACTEVCPTRIEVKKGIPGIRGKARSSKKGIPPEHDALVSSVRNYDNPWMVPRKQKGRWAHDLKLPTKGEVLYFAGCSTSLVSPGTSKAAVRVLRGIGFDPAHLGSGERCCGSTLRKIGESGLAVEKARGCIEDFRAAGAKVVVTSCPGCSSALNRHRDLLDKHGIRVLHISKFLDEHLNKSDLTAVRRAARATFHDPCDLGRESGIFEEPRRLLEAVLGKRLIEMGRSRSGSACCGSGAGVRSTYPELSNAIAKDRVEMARAAGADTIVTSCPWCVQSLRDCQSDGPKIEVVDLVNLIDESMSNRVKSGQP